MLDKLQPFQEIEQPDDEVATVQRIVRRELHSRMNYWDYLIRRVATDQQDLRDLFASRKTDIAWRFINHYL